MVSSIEGGPQRQRSRPPEQDAFDVPKIGPVHNLLHHVVETVTLGLILSGEKERKSIVFGLRCSLENVEPENCSEHCSLDFSGFRFFVTVC